MSNQVDKSEDGRWIAEDAECARIFASFRMPYVLRAELPKTTRPVPAPAPPAPPAPAVATSAPAYVPKPFDAAAFDAEVAAIREAKLPRRHLAALSDEEQREYVLQVVSAEARGVAAPTLPVTDSALASGKAERLAHLDGVLNRYREIHGAARPDKAESIEAEQEIIALVGFEKVAEMRAEVNKSRN